MSLRLERVIYVSEATQTDPTVAILADILATSDRNNRRDGVTGALVVTATRFLQILEGARQDLDRTLDRLRDDSRHHDIAILCRGPIHHRRFANWTMAAAGISISRAPEMDEIVELASSDPETATLRVLALVEAQVRAQP